MRVLYILGVLPSDPAVKAMTDAEWEVAYYFFNKFEEEKTTSWMEFLQHNLGTIITSEDVYQSGGTTNYLGEDKETPKELPKKVFLPLLLGLKPELQKHLKQSLAPPELYSDEDAAPMFSRWSGRKTTKPSRKKAEVEGYELTKEDFKTVSGSARGWAESASSTKRASLWNPGDVKGLVKGVLPKKDLKNSTPPKRLKT